MPGPNGEPGGMLAGGSAVVVLPHQGQLARCRLIRVVIGLIGGSSTLPAPPIRRGRYPTTKRGSASQSLAQ